jgi:hypothetical protein
MRVHQRPDQGASGPVHLPHRPGHAPRLPHTQERSSRTTRARGAADSGERGCSPLHLRPHAAELLARCAAPLRTIPTPTASRRSLRLICGLETRTPPASVRRREPTLDRSTRTTPNPAAPRPDTLLDRTDRFSSNACPLHVLLSRSSLWHSNSFVTSQHVPPLALRRPSLGPLPWPSQRHGPAPETPEVAG